MLKILCLTKRQRQSLIPSGYTRGATLLSPSIFQWPCQGSRPKQSLWDNSGRACLSGGATLVMAGITQMIVSDGFCQRTDGTARNLSAACIKKLSIHKLNNTKWLKTKKTQTTVHHKENRFFQMKIWQQKRDKRLQDYFYMEVWENTGEANQGQGRHWNACENHPTEVSSVTRGEW